MNRSYVLRGAYVLEESGDFSGPTDIAVEGGRVADVGRGLRMQDVLQIDASETWIMPGVFDCHAHPAMWARDAEKLLRTPITAWALAAASMLRETLRTGVTFLRDAGGADPGLRTAIDEGDAVGPHLQLSIVLLTQTGGQMDGFLAGPGLELPINYLLPDYPGRPPYRVDGVDEMRRAVRQLVRAGADWIKLCAGSGPHLEGQDWNGVEFSPEEIETAVLEAHRARRWVMCDAKTPESIEMCVRAGVRSIEHGLFLDEKCAALMAEHEVWLVPTFSVYEDFTRQADNGQLSAATTAVVRDMRERSKDRLEMALEAGVRIAVGSDAFGREMHGANLAELVYMHRAGMPAREVLVAATSGGAELCGVASERGRISPGCVFDAIVLEQDPSDLSVFGERDAVKAVFKGGALQFAHPRFDQLTTQGGRRAESA